MKTLEDSPTARPETSSAPSLGGSMKSRYKAKRSRTQFGPLRTMGKPNGVTKPSHTRAGGPMTRSRKGKQLLKGV